MANLLLVEDDADVADALAEVLQQLRGDVVRIARDGREGLAYAASDRPDLLLLDLEMPRLGGRAVVRGMLSENRGLEEIPVVLLSGVPRLEEIASEVGTPYFLAKPFRLQHVLDVIDRALAEHRAPRPPKPERPPEALS